jgi:outer membrane protein OmpA-like peptidoglycan-associated protein
MRVSIIVIAAIAVAATTGCQSKPAHVAPVKGPPGADSARLAKAHADSVTRAAAVAKAAETRTAVRAEVVADSTRIAAEEKKNIEIRTRAELVAPITFESKSVELRLPERTMLDHKAAILKANAAVRMRIDGNVDEKEAASDKDKLALGMQRAVAAQKYLTEHGVEASRIDVTSSGAGHPICQDHFEWCWSQNRRNEFTIVAGGEHLSPGR